MLKRLSLFLFACILSFAIHAQEDTIQRPSKEYLKSLLKRTDLPQGDRINNLRMLGEYYMGQPGDTASYYFNSALGLSKISNDSFNAMRMFNRLALLEIYYENDDVAIVYADSAFTYANWNNQRYYASIGYSNRIQAMAYYYQERNDLALERLLQANRYLLKDEQSDEIKTYLAENYSDLASIYLEIDEKKTAIECINKSLSLSRPIESWVEMGEGYEFLASYYSEEKEYEKARTYLDSARVMFEQVEYKEAITSVDKSRATIFLEEDQHNDAIMLYLELLKEDKKAGMPYLLAEGYNFLSEAYTKKGELPKAKTYLDSAKTAAAQSGNVIHDISIARQQAKIYEKEGLASLAAGELTRILATPEIQYYKESEKEIYEELYELYDKLGDGNKAYMYFKKHNNIKDSLRLVLQDNKFNVLQSEFNYNELISTIEARDAQLKFSRGEQKRIKERDFFIIGIVSLVALFALVLFFRQRKLSNVKREAQNSKQEVMKIKQEVLDGEVRFKNKQITDFAIHISEKNDLLETIKTRLKGVKVINDRHKELVSDTIHFINQDIEQNKEKIQLYQQVNETNDSFRAKIDRMYTSLSEKERKVATMLRIGQTSKQIGLQLGISPASVDNYRYSLRKKMNIPKGESLKVFINKI